MKTLSLIAVAWALAVPAFGTETLITKRKITDTVSARGIEQPLQIQNELTWIGKDSLRVDIGAWSTIVRSDTKKLYQINHEAQSYSVVDLPFDVKKYITADEAKKLEELTPKISVTLTPTTETKKFKDWTATKYVMTISVPKRGVTTEQIWAASDVGFDTSRWFELISARLSLQPVGAMMAAEHKKVVGFPVFVERTQAIENHSFGGRDEVLSIESKDAPAGTFEVPKDYKEKPFEMLDASMKVRPPVEAEIIRVEPSPKPPPKDPPPPTPPPK